MVEVFITNINKPVEAAKILTGLQSAYPGLDINIELNGAVSTYPCGHSILRTEGFNINAKNIMLSVTRSGFQCDILEDKTCK